MTTLAMFSGGLDSTLAICVLKEQNVEVTAPDFVRSFTRTLTPAGPEAPFFDILGGYITNYYLKDVIAGAQQYFDGTADRVSGLEAPDTHTFKIHLVQPVGDLGYRVAWNALGPSQRG